MIAPDARAEEVDSAPTTEEADEKMRETEANELVCAAAAFVGVTVEMCVLVETETGVEDALLDDNFELVEDVVDKVEEGVLASVEVAAVLEVVIGVTLVLVDDGVA